MLFDNLFGLIRVVIVGLLAYGSLILVLRLSGKRSLAKLNAFDFVVTVALGSTLASVLLSSDVALLEGLVAFGLLALLQWIVARLSIASSGFRKLVRSQPRLLLEHGRFREEAMAAERITQDEIVAMVRSAGIGQIEDVGAVVLETDGSLSVIRSSDQPLTALANVKR
jgi:uncharacterized membrane protein YcaP (DUF421 family)